MYQTSILLNRSNVLCKSNLFFSRVTYYFDCRIIQATNFFSYTYNLIIHETNMRNSIKNMKNYILGQRRPWSPKPGPAVPAEFSKRSASGPAVQGPTRQSALSITALQLQRTLKSRLPPVGSPQHSGPDSDSPHWLKVTWFSPVHVEQRKLNKVFFFPLATVITN